MGADVQPCPFPIPVGTGLDGLAGLMQWLLTGHAVWFNRRHKRHEQLFQNRYKSIICQEDT
jgi:hypothetical protein